MASEKLVQKKKLLKENTLNLNYLYYIINYANIEVEQKNDTEGGAAA